MGNLPRRLMARLQILDLPIEVRILAGQQEHCGFGIADFGLGVVSFENTMPFQTAITNSNSDILLGLIV